MEFPLTPGTNPKTPVLTALSWWKRCPKGPRMRAWCRRRDSLLCRHGACHVSGWGKPMKLLQSHCSIPAVLWLTSEKWITWRGLRLIWATPVLLHSWGSPQDYCWWWFIAVCHERGRSYLKVKDLEYLVLTTCKMKRRSLTRTAQRCEHLREAAANRWRESKVIERGLWFGWEVAAIAHQLPRGCWVVWKCHCKGEFQGGMVGRTL